MPLNFAAISHEIDFDRDTVERGIKEVLLALSRSVKGGHHVEFTFPSIGKLLIKNSNVKMKFYKDFLQNIDSSGAVAKALRNVGHKFVLWKISFCQLRPPRVLKST